MSRYYPSSEKLLWGKTKDREDDIPHGTAWFMELMPLKEKLARYVEEPFIPADLSCSSRFIVGDQCSSPIPSWEYPQEYAPQTGYYTGRHRSRCAQAALDAYLFRGSRRGS